MDLKRTMVSIGVQLQNQDMVKFLVKQVKIGVNKLIKERSNAQTNSKYVNHNYFAANLKTVSMEFFLKKILFNIVD